MAESARIYDFPVEPEGSVAPEQQSKGVDDRLLEVAFGAGGYMLSLVERIAPTEVAEPGSFGGRVAGLFAYSQRALRGDWRPVANDDVIARHGAEPEVGATSASGQGNVIRMNGWKSKK